MARWRKIRVEGRNWRKYFDYLKVVLEPRFLQEIVIPHDVISFADKIKISETHDRDVFRFIIAASVFNGILIGLPGSLGLGVIPAMVVEVLMALQIARMVGLLGMDVIDALSISRVLKLISAAGLTTLTVAYGFKIILNFFLGFS